MPQDSYQTKARGSSQNSSPSGLRLAVLLPQFWWQKSYQKHQHLWAALHTTNHKYFLHFQSCSLLCFSTALCQLRIPSAWVTPTPGGACMSITQITGVSQQDHHKKSYVQGIRDYLSHSYLNKTSHLPFHHSGCRTQVLKESQSAQELHSILTVCSLVIHSLQSQLILHENSPCCWQQLALLQPLQIKKSF